MNHRFIQDITDFIFMNDTPLKSDIIFIPGTSKSGISEKAAELFRGGYAEFIMPSGRYSPTIGKFARVNIDSPLYDGDFTTDCEYCTHILTVNGVPRDAIIPEDLSTNTMENAAFSARILTERNMEIRRAILCCQAFHARRAFMSYARHFPNADILVVPTDTQGICRDSWHLNEKSYRKVMSEVAKCGRYFLDFHTD